MLLSWLCGAARLLLGALVRMAIKEYHVFMGLSMESSKAASGALARIVFSIYRRSVLNCVPREWPTKRVRGGGSVGGVSC